MSRTHLEPLPLLALSTGQVALLVRGAVQDVKARGTLLPRALDVIAEHVEVAKELCGKGMCEGTLY